MDNSGYQGLIRFAEAYERTLKELNLQSLKLINSDGFKQAFKNIQLATEVIVPHVDTTILGIAEAVQKAIPKMDIATQHIAQTLQEIAARYKTLFGSYDFATLSDSMRATLENSQLTSIMQLSLSYQTEMIHDAIGCFANAEYEYLPGVFNTAMKKPIIGAADIAFLKTGMIIPVIESELVFPKGIKTSLKVLNRSTAENIADSEEINYNTIKNKFIASDSVEDSKGLNIILAGKEIIDPDDDLFTDVELMDFVSFLSRTPMMGMAVDAGKKIFNWLKELLEKKTNLINFDQEFYYHSRSRDKNTMPFTFEQMKSAPYGVSSAGRFNQIGRAHFYFSNTQRGAEIEVSKHKKDEDTIQTIKLTPVKPIRMLDLSHTLQRGATFLRMIRYPLDDANKMPRQYLLPCFVADCCQNIGFDGIKYFGSKEYDNYVSWDDSYFADAGMCG